MKTVIIMVFALSILWMNMQQTTAAFALHLPIAASSPGIVFCILVTGLAIIRHFLTVAQRLAFQNQNILHWPSSWHSLLKWQQCRCRLALPYLPKAVARFQKRKVVPLLKGLAVYFFCAHVFMFCLVKLCDPLWSKTFLSFLRTSF